MMKVLFFAYAISVWAGRSERRKSPGQEIRGAVSLVDILAVSIEAVESGGNVLKKYREQNELGIREKDGKNDLVTLADEESNRRIVAIFRHIFPNLPSSNIRSEEVSEPSSTTPVEVEEISRKIKTGVYKKLGLRDELKGRRLFSEAEKLYLVNPEEVTIWIDPMDATKEYTENLTEYTTVMIGVAVRGKPVLGIIRKPFEDVTYWGIDWVGVISSVAAIPQKAFKLKDVKTNIKELAEAAIPKVIVSRSHPGDVEDRLRAAVGEVEIIKAGGSGYKSMEVLKGTSAAYIHTGWIKLWDLCAPNAILNAAGGRLSSLDGSEINYHFDQNYKHTGGVSASLLNHEMWVGGMWSH